MPHIVRLESGSEITHSFGMVESVHCQLSVGVLNPSSTQGDSGKCRKTEIGLRSYFLLPLLLVVSVARLLFSCKATSSLRLPLTLFCLSSLLITERATTQLWQSAISGP